jgi:queuosine precursor transporter
MRQFRYFDLVMAAFVAVLLCSNLIGPAKVVTVDLPLWGALSFSAAVLYFPISYVFGDVLTEVYGYAAARRVIWTGFAAVAFASAMAALTVWLPPDSTWPHQAAYETVFGSTWRIVVASMIAYFCGSFVNAFVLAKMKLWTGGRHLWTRTIGSTMIGQAVDTGLFFPIAFLGSSLFPQELLLTVALTEFCMKVGIEAALTPATYRIVGALKRTEQVDTYDRDTKFSPFAA